MKNVYAVLRSNEPLDPTKNLLQAFLEDARVNSAGTHERIQPGPVMLQQAVAALGRANLPPAADQETHPGADEGTDQQTLVSLDDIDFVLKRESPRTEANGIAADILGLATQIRREKNWSRAERAGALVLLWLKLVDASGRFTLEGLYGLETIRAVIREELLRAGSGTTVNQVPQQDPAALREMVAREIREGVTAAGRDRWSTEPLSKMIEKFVEARYATGDGKSRIGSKHRQDVERRLQAVLSFVGDVAVRDITRNHLKTYRDVLDRLPNRFDLRFETQDMRLAIDLNAKQRYPFAAMGPTTINLKWLGPVDRLFDWLVFEEKIEKNPLNIWASWCAPCHDEAPLLTELAKDKRFQAVGINYKDAPDNARRFLGRYGNPFAIVGVDGNGRAVVEWGVYGVPETFIVGRDGAIAYKLVGPITAENIDGLVKVEIDKALTRPE